jgi:hypothetical protein
MSIRTAARVMMPGSRPEFVELTVRQQQRKLVAAALGCAAALFLGASPLTLTAAEPQEPTLRAYRAYRQAASEEFMRRVRDGGRWWTEDPRIAERLRREGLAARPAREDGIVGVDGGLVHHWRGVALIRGAALPAAVQVSQAYVDYAEIYGPVIASRLLEREGDTYRVLLRVKEGAKMVSAVLDIWSTVRYGGGAGHAFAVSEATQIRQVDRAGEPDEQYLSPERDAGYLWQASTFTRYVAQEEGVYVELETLGLSRGFPPMLGWIIEPIARRLGRSSVEVSLREFRRAVESGKKGQHE